MARPKKVKPEVEQTETPQSPSETLLKAEEKLATLEVAIAPHSADLRVTSRFDYTGQNAGLLKKYPPNLGHILYGNIFNDTATHSNHPFKDGVHINTSLVLEYFEKDGEQFVRTLNSVYRLIK